MDDFSIQNQRTSALGFIPISEEKKPSPSGTPKVADVTNEQGRASNRWLSLEYPGSTPDLGNFQIQRENSPTDNEINDESAWRDIDSPTARERLTEAPQEGAVEEEDLSSNSHEFDLRENIFQTSDSKTSSEEKSGSPENRTPDIPAESLLSISREDDEWETVSDPDSRQDPIKESKRLLAKHHFNPALALSLRAEICRHRECLRQLLSSKDSIELRRAIDHLTLREAALTQYIQSNPFNDKNVLRPRRNLIEGVLLLSENVIQFVKDQSRTRLFTTLNRQEQLALQAALEHGLPQFRSSIEAWHANEVQICDEADPERCSYPPQFYRNNKTAANPIALYTKEYFFEQFVTYLRSAGIPEKIINKINIKHLQIATEIAMNEIQAWNVTERDMTVAAHGETKRFRQTSTPISASNTAVGRTILSQGVHGIVPGTRADGRAPINTRMTQLLEVLDRNEGEESFPTLLVHERLQHGINDHFHLDEPERTLANERSAMELIQYGIEADPEFVRELLRKEATGETGPSQAVFINVNLTTPTKIPRDNPLKKSTHDERTYSDRQGAALRAASGEGKVFQLAHPETGEVKPATLDVALIDLRFPVNYAVNSIVGALDPGMMLFGTWDELHLHNEKEFKKLFGSLKANDPIEGLIGPTYRKLREAASNEELPSKELIELRTLCRAVEDQCEIVRDLFSSKAYQSSTRDGDPMKLARHVDLLANKFREAKRLLGDLNTRVINAGGCMSGKDREGVAHAEALAAVMMERLAVPYPLGRSFRDEERVIYDTAVTLVVDNTLLVTGYGGSKNAEEVASRIKNKYAVEYAAGLSHKAKT